MSRTFGLMVTRNEEGRYLESVLEHNRPFLDGLFVYDDRSSDRTVDICRSFAVVERRPLDQLSFAEHEGSFRAAAWRQFEICMAPRGADLVVVFDADEFFLGDPAAFGGTAGRIRIHEGWRAVDKTLWERVDGQWGKIHGLRLYRWFNHFLDGMHDLERRPSASGVGPATRSQIFDGFSLLHVGYVDDEDKKAKYARYRRDPRHGSRHVTSILAGYPSLREMKGIPTTVEAALSRPTQ